MSTLTTIQSTDLITNSRAVINDNFSALNTDKMETSVLDTDTTLAANSDLKVPSQKAVKAYVDAGGQADASTTEKGIVEIATQTEVNAGTSTGATGASLVVNPSNLDAWATDSNILSKIGAGSTTFDMTSVNGATTVIAHGLGVVPKLVRVRANLSLGTAISYAEAVYTSTQSSLSTFFGSTTGEATATFKLRSDVSPDRSHVGTITTDATNITITWAKTSTPTGTANISWYALGA